MNLGTAGVAPSAANPKQATWIEHCECLPGFVGQFCESCESGFRRETKFGGPFNHCIKCDCHNHSNSCEAESGSCICEHNTAGDTCERCARGYYGDALQGTEEDCQKCPCPNDGPCILHADGDVICTECPNGYTGRRCDECSDGYFGNPKDGTECVECACSGNTDPNSIGNCDKITGECKKCIFNTHGFNCENCKPGYWGDALIEPKGNCQSCGCFAAGTRRPNNDYTLLECNQQDGQCDCLPNVIGIQCDQCAHGFYNITSGLGCQECNCDPLGSEGNTCDVNTGQCQCKPGVTGQRCDRCADYHFGFSANGCQPCDCEYIGSENQQCDVNSGQCLCKENVEGRRCDQCAENRYGITQGCLPCDDCYTLIQSRVNVFREKVKSLDNTLQEIIENPAPVNDTKFDEKVKETSRAASEVWEAVKQKTSEFYFQKVTSYTFIHFSEEGGGTIKTKSKAIKDEIVAALEKLTSIDESVAQAKVGADAAENDMKRWEIIIENARREIENVLHYLETEGEERAQIAYNASQKYGEQSKRMSELASGTREEAEKHLKQASEIEQLSEQAIANATQANKEASDAIYGGEQISKQIAELKEKQNQLNESIHRTLDLAEEQKKSADEANNLAAVSLTNVEAVKIPSVDPKELRNDVAGVLEESENLVDSSVKENSANDELFDEVNRSVADARNELQSSQDQQRVSDQLMLELEKSRERIVDSVSTADKTLKDAEAALQVLEEFGAKIEKSRNDAVAEFAGVEGINQRLDDIIDAQDKRRNSLPIDKQFVIDYRKSADVLLNETHALADRYKDIIHSDVDTRDSTEAVQYDIEQLMEELTDSNENLQYYKKQAEDDKQMATEAVRKATLAKNSAIEANATILAEEDEIKKIINSLGKNTI